MFIRDRTVTVPQPLTAHCTAFTDFELLHILITPAPDLAGRRSLILEEDEARAHSDELFTTVVK